MMNVLIAAVLWGSSGVCAQYIMEQSQMSSQFLTMTRLIFAGLILLMLSFVHGDKVFSIIKNRKDAISLLIFSVVGALTVQLTFLLTIEKSNAATATVLQFFVTDHYRGVVFRGAQSSTGDFSADCNLHLAHRHLLTGHPR
ncbi:hypothetical protein [Citrobacter freundii]|uniref:EamA domain-containing protein n=1 Tax=Citrobacter freundii TaxID=546 RepID=A0A7G2IVZ0_CITFR|nr:hypothetical protein [Citrobacter freundii]